MSIAGISRTTAPIVAPAADELDWEKGGGLLPVIVQHVVTGAVLMLGYMNREAYAATLASGQATFYSRSRRQLWRKGETSGNTLAVSAIRADCDADTLVLSAQPAGPTCHRGTTSCFGDPPPATLLEELSAVIDQRLAERPDGSYVASVGERGLPRAAQKLGEEAVELALAAVSRDEAGVAEEAADVLFHLLIVLRLRGVSLETVLDRLAARRRPAP